MPSPLGKQLPLLYAGNVRPPLFWCFKKMQYVVVPCLVLLLRTVGHQPLAQAPASAGLLLGCVRGGLSRSQGAAGPDRSLCILGGAVCRSQAPAAQELAVPESQQWK